MSSSNLLPFRTFNAVEISGSAAQGYLTNVEAGKNAVWDNSFGPAPTANDGTRHDDLGWWRLEADQSIDRALRFFANDQGSRETAYAFAVNFGEGCTIIF